MMIQNWEGKKALIVEQEMLPKEKYHLEKCFWCLE